MFALFITLLIILLILWFCLRRMRLRSAIFFDKSQASEYFIAHHSEYINSLTPEERRIKSIDMEANLSEIANNSVLEFTRMEKKVIRSQIPYDNIPLPWFFIKVSSLSMYGGFFLSKFPIFVNGHMYNSSARFKTEAILA